MTPVSAHDELRALLQRYARAADERDVEALESLFHPDAHITGSAGTQTRQEWLATMRGARAFPLSMHVINDPLVELDDTGEHAVVDSYAVVYQLSEPGSGHGDLTLGIRYVDEVVRHGGHWVILERRARTVWMR